MFPKQTKLNSMSPVGIPGTCYLVGFNIVIMLLKLGK